MQYLADHQCSTSSASLKLLGVIATIGSLFSEATVVAMKHTTTGLTDPELASLGFRRIAGSGLIYRHSALRSEFTDAYRFSPSGSPFNRSMAMISWKNQGSPEFLRNIAHIDGYFVPSYSFQSLNR